MDKYKLVSEYRESSGKSPARKLRKGGKIPAVIYGHRKEPIGLAINGIEFKQIYSLHGESAIFDLSIKGKVKEECNAIIRDVQRHPATGNILHVDLQRISLDEKVRVEIPVSMKGNPKGVKEGGGILEHGLRVLNITCVPAAIPESFEIDVNDLEIGNSIHVDDIKGMYSEVEFLDPGDSVIANVVPPIVEVTPAVEEEAEEAPEEPELISKEKKEEAEEEGGKEE